MYNRGWREELFWRVTLHGNCIHVSTSSDPKECLGVFLCGYGGKKMTLHYPFTNLCNLQEIAVMFKSDRSLLGVTHCLAIKSAKEDNSWGDKVP